MSRHTSAAFETAPSRTTLSIATFISQLLGMVAFLMAATWMLNLGHRDAGVTAVAVFGALSVFAGGQAHRGSIGALGMCVAIDLTIGVACLIRGAAVTKFIYAPMTWATPKIASDVDLAMSMTSLVALLAAVVSILAVPQTRRYLAWHRVQTTLTPPVW